MSTDLEISSGPLAEISQGPSAFEAFLDRNQKLLILAGIALTVAAIAFVVYRGISKGKRETAGAALVKAEDVAGFQAVANDHANTAAGGSAMILLANSQWEAGKKDEAVATLEKLISSHPQHPVISTARVNLGSKLLVLGKTGDAAKAFEAVVSDSSASHAAPFALISLGDIAKSAGDLTKAEGYYNDVKKKFSDSLFVDAADKRLETLKAKAPTEIEPPAPPAPAPSIPVPPVPKDPAPADPAPGGQAGTEPAPAPAPTVPAPPNP